MELKTMYAPKPGSPKTTLTESITSTKTDLIKLDDVSVLPPPPNLAVIYNRQRSEVVMYEGTTSEGMTSVTRAVGDGASLQAWDISDGPVYVARNFTAVDYAAITDNINTLANGYDAGQIDINKNISAIADIKKSINSLPTKDDLDNCQKTLQNDILNLPISIINITDFNSDAAWKSGIYFAHIINNTAHSPVTVLTDSSGDAPCSGVLIVSREDSGDVQAFLYDGKLYCRTRGTDDWTSSESSTTEYLKTELTTRGIRMLTANDDYDDAINPGIYYCLSKAGAPNCPVAIAFNGVMIVSRVAPYVMQSVLNGDTHYSRRNENGIWTDWQNAKISNISAAMDDRGIYRLRTGNLDDIISPGIYFCGDADNISNGPLESGTEQSKYYTLLVSNIDDDTCCHTVLCGYMYYYRFGTPSVGRWSSWESKDLRNVLVSGDLTAMQVLHKVSDSIESEPPTKAGSPGDVCVALKTIDGEQYPMLYIWSGEAFGWLEVASSASVKALAQSQ